MRDLVTVLCCSVLASCSSPTSVPLDQRARDLVPSWQDRGPGEQRQREARPPDVRLPDVRLPDVRLPDVRLPDARPPDVQSAVDKKLASEVTAGSLQVKVVSVYVWANLMPIVAPDPTGVTLELSFTNSGATNVTSLQLTDGQLQPVPSGSAQAIDLQAQAPFSGVVPAGQTVTATFTKVKKNTTVPLPTTCGGKVKVGFKVSHATGSLGPLWSGDVAFVCAY